MSREFPSDRFVPIYSFKCPMESAEDAESGAASV